MNFNNQQSQYQTGDLNYLVLEYLKKQPGFQANDKADIIQQLEKTLEYGQIYNTKLEAFQSDYALRKEMFNVLKRRGLEDITENYLNYDKNETPYQLNIYNENKYLSQTANDLKYSDFTMIHQMKHCTIDKNTARRFQRNTMNNYQHMKTMLGHITLVDNTIVNPVPIYCITYSDDDKMVFTADNNGMIKIWSTITGALIDVFKSHEKGVNTIIFIKHFLISCSEDQSVIIWDVNTLQMVKMFNFDEVIVRLVHYDYQDIKSGKEHTLIVISSLSGKMYFVDLDKAVKKKSSMAMELEEEEYPVKFYFDKRIVEKYNLKKTKGIEQSSICANSKHGILVCGFIDGTICVWDFKRILDDSIMNKRFIHDFEKYVLFLNFGHNSNVHLAEFSSNNMNFITGSLDGHVGVWKVQVEVLEKMRNGTINTKNNQYYSPIYCICTISENEDRTRCAVNCSIWSKKSSYVLSLITSKKRKKNIVLDAQKRTELPLTVIQSQGPFTVSQGNNSSPNQENIHSSKKSSSLIVYSLKDNKVIRRYNESNGFNSLDDNFILESHPINEDVILSILDTKDIILFNFISNETIAKFRNHNYFFTDSLDKVIASEGQFSNRGDSFVISSYSGFISIYSLYSPNSYSTTYMNQFISREFSMNDSNNKENKTLNMNTIFPSYVNMHDLPHIIDQPHSQVKLKQIEELHSKLQAKLNISQYDIQHRYAKANYENYGKNAIERRLECEKEELAFQQAIKDNMTYRVILTDANDVPEEEDNLRDYDDDVSYRSAVDGQDVIEIESENDGRLSMDDQDLVNDNRDNLSNQSGGGTYNLRSRRNNHPRNTNSQPQRISNRIQTRSSNRIRTNGNQPQDTRNNSSNRFRKRLRLRKNRNESGPNDENNNSDIEYERAINNTSLGRKKKTSKYVEDDDESEDHNNNNNDDDEFLLPPSHHSNKRRSTAHQDLMNKISKDNQEHQCFFCKSSLIQFIFGPFYLNEFNRVSLTDSTIETCQEIYIDMNCLFTFNDFIAFTSTDKLDILKTIESIIENNQMCYRCNSPYATKKCSEDSCNRYFHGNTCLLKMCIDYSKSLQTENSFTQCLRCYRNNFSDDIDIKGKPNHRIDMAKVPKNFFLNERLCQSSYFPQKKEIVYFILQGYELFLMQNFEHIIYELDPETQESQYDSIFFWKKSDKKEHDNNDTFNYNLPFKCRIEEIEYKFLSNFSLLFIEKLTESKCLEDKIRILIKLKLTIIDTNRSIQLIFMENEQPDFLIREKLYENNLQMYQDKMKTNNADIQIFIENKLYSAKIVKYAPKEHNESFKESFYENMAVQFPSTSIDEDKDEEMTISFWDLYDPTFHIENSTLQSLCNKILSHVNNIMTKNEENLSVFFDCVDEIRDNAVGYYNFVEVPMYLKLIQERMVQLYYLTIESMIFDFELILSNAKKYNHPRSPLVTNAQILYDRIVNLINGFMKESNPDEGSLREKNSYLFNVEQPDKGMHFSGKKKKRISNKLGLDDIGLDEDDLAFHQRSLRKRNTNNVNVNTMMTNNNNDIMNSKGKVNELKQIPISFTITKSLNKNDKKDIDISENESEIEENYNNTKGKVKKNIEGTLVNISRTVEGKSLRPRNKFKINY